MDPNETLKEIRTLTYATRVRDLNPEESDRLAVLFDALDEWMSRGGFLPTDWSAHRV